MKQLRLTLIVGLMMGWILQTHAQICVIDSTVGSVPGLYPDSLSDGAVNVAYAQTISLVLPTDTTVNIGPPIGSIALDFCSFRVDSIQYLPAGLSYECNAPNCIWQIDHSGVVNRGCAVISGIPLDTVPNDSILVFVTVGVGTYDSVNNVCDTLQFPLPPTLTSQAFKVRLHIDTDTVATSIENLVEADLAVTIYPNPTSTSSTLRYELPEQARVDVGLYDTFGRRVRDVFSGTKAAGNAAHTLSTAGLAPGIYLVRIDLNEGKNAFTRKLVVQ